MGRQALTRNFLYKLNRFFVVLGRLDAVKINVFASHSYKVIPILQGVEKIVMFDFNFRVFYHKCWLSHPRHAK